MVMQNSEMMLIVEQVMYSEFRNAIHTCMPSVIKLFYFGSINTLVVYIFFFFSKQCRFKI